MISFTDILGILGFLLSMGLVVLELWRRKPRIGIHDPKVIIYPRVATFIETYVENHSDLPISITASDIIVGSIEYPHTQYRTLSVDNGRCRISSSLPFNVEPRLARKIILEFRPGLFDPSQPEAMDNPVFYSFELRFHTPRGGHIASIEAQSVELDEWLKEWRKDHYHSA